MEKKNLQFRFNTRTDDVIVINVYTVADADVFVDMDQHEIKIMNDTNNEKEPKLSTIKFPTNAKFIGASC